MVGTVETTYVLDIATPLTMVLSETTGGQTTRYWHALDTLAQSDGTTTEYFGYDGLGSVRQMVDASGSVGLAQTFDPYGTGYAKAGLAQSTLGYSGEQTDANGFVYLRARYYQPGMGRFTQMDPSRQERNAYQYSFSDPINISDPTGTLPCDGLTGSNLTSCLDAIEVRLDALWLVAHVNPIMTPGPKFAGRLLDHYLTGTGTELQFGPKDFSRDYRKAVGEAVATHLKDFSTLRSDLQGFYDTQFCAGELPVWPWNTSGNTFFNTYSFSIPFSIPEYYNAIGTQTLASYDHQMSKVTIGRRYFNPKQGKVTVETPIELYDLYDWCYGAALCEATDTHPFGMRAGEFMALEQAGRAAQFDWYAHWVVITEFDIDGNSGTILVTGSRYKGYRSMAANIPNYRTPDCRVYWNGLDSSEGRNCQGYQNFDDDWLDPNTEQFCTIDDPSTDYVGCTPNP